MKKVKNNEQLYKNTDDNYWKISLKKKLKKLSVIATPLKFVAGKSRWVKHPHHQSRASESDEDEQGHEQQDWEHPLVSRPQLDDPPPI